MTRIKDRHPQKDFFVADLSDVIPKDDLASMEHPLFSLATKPDLRHLVYKTENTRLEITPSGAGLPTIFDKDILIFCISQLIHAKNRGEEISSTVRFNAHELMIATNRTTDGDSYQRLGKAFIRLRGTTFTTNIQTGGKRENRTFGMVDEATYVFHDNEKQRLDFCEVKLSDWVMRSIESKDVVTISQDYFRLRRPLERRIYEIARKHCGNQKRWHIRLANLQTKTGSNAPIKKFRMNIRSIISKDVTPFYKMELTSDDLVIFRPRAVKNEFKDIIIPEWAEEKAREHAIRLGWDYHVLRENWLEFARAETARGNAPQNAGAAFVSYAKKQKNQRGY